MGMMAETYVLQAIQNGLASIAGNTAQLAEILDALNTSELAAAQSYFGNPAANKIIVAPGFPMEPTQLPFIGVTVANAEQSMRHAPIGLQMAMTHSGSTWVNTQGAVFDGTIKCTLYTPNADLVIWLSEIMAWAMLSQFALFTNAGFGNLQVVLGDYEPQPAFLPIFTFARGVFLRALFTKSFTTAPLQSITSATVTLTDTNS